MKKTIAFLLLICTLTLCFTSCGDYEELLLKTNEIITCKNNEYSLTAIVDYEGSEISEGEEVTINSSNENIAKLQNDKIVFGNEYGEATLEIIIGNKKGNLSVKVVPYIEYLRNTATKENASGFSKLDYCAASWIISNLNAFKNPASVSVTDVLYVDGTVSSTDFNASYLIMEIRAQNGFGGYGVSYYKVTRSTIEEATVYSYGGLFKSYNGFDLYTGGAYSVNKAVQEYIEENY